MIERILNYKVTFKAGSEEEIAEAWKLSSCVEMTNRDIDSEDDINRCFSVDYNKLKSMKNKTIDVSVEAFYDNGLMGYDYDVWDGTSENTQYDYKYMIMQNNLAVDGSAKYIILSSGTSNTPSVWSEELGVGTGYYIYSPDAGSIVDKGLITYHNMLNDKAANLSYNLTSLGYRINLGTINPKMISTVPMKPKGANTFSFSSIVPKVTVGTKSQLINGGVVNLTLTGADLTDFKKEDGEYYLYIDTWADEESANNESNNKVRPQLKIKIDKNDPSRTVEAVIDGLREESTYYFNVYAKMKKGSEWPLTRLNDSDYRDEYKPKTHSITSISGKGRVTNLIVDYSINDSEANSGGYGKRDLDTTMTLKSYIGEYPFNYDVLYVFCNAGSDCVNKEGGANPIIEDEPILYRTVPKENVAKTLAIKDDISSKDLEFGKRNGYRMYVYAVVDYYDDGNLIKRYVPMQVEGSLTNVSLSSLTEPDFTVERNALIVDGEYAIRFDITPTDPSRTLTNGVYHVDLLDSNGQSVGTMKILEGSNYVPTGNNEFSAFDLGKVVLFTGLNAHTKYTVAVYGEAYVNNYSETIPKEERRYEARKTHTVYSVNNYGVGFGNNVLYSATEKSVVATFLGGSNFDNVVQVRYTIGLWDDNNSTSISGKYIKGTSGFDSLIVDEETIPITPPKAFVRPTAVSNWRFVIDPPGMKIVLGEPYDAILSFVVKNPNFDPANPDDPTNPEYVTLTHQTTKCLPLQRRNMHV